MQTRAHVNFQRRLRLTSGLSRRPVLLRVVFAVSAAARARDPLGVLPVPADRLLKAALPGLARAPPQLRLDLRSLNRVAAAVAGARFDELQQASRVAGRVQDGHGYLAL